jgi:hypothetical protein
MASLRRPVRIGDLLATERLGNWGVNPGGYGMDMDDMDDVEDVDRYSSDRVTLLEIRVSRQEEQMRSTAVNRVAGAFEQVVQERRQFPQGMAAPDGATRVRVVEKI